MHRQIQLPKMHYTSLSNFLGVFQSVRYPYNNCKMKWDEQYLLIRIMHQASRKTVQKPCCKFWNGCLLERMPSYIRWVVCPWKPSTIFALHCQYCYRQTDKRI